MSDLAIETEKQEQLQAQLEKAWNAVPQAGKKGCAVDANKEIVGVLAITDDETLILKRQCPDDFVVVAREEAADWRISPYNDSHKVNFVFVSDLLS